MTNTTRMKLTILSGLAVLVMVPLAMAQEEQSQAQQRRRQEARRQQQQQQAQQQQRRQVTGRILRSKSVDVRGQDMKRRVVLLETDQGNRLIVDLGPVQETRNLDLNQGQRCTVAGRIVRVGDRRVLMAERVRAGERTAQVSMGQRGQQQRQQRISGQLTALRKFSPPGIDQTFVFAQIETDQGRRILANLGPQQRIRNLNLSSGDQITAWGRRIEVRGKPIFITHRLQSNEQTVTVARRDQRQMRQDRQVQQLTGEVNRLGRFSPPGADRTFIFAEITTDQGRKRTVNLGPQQRLQDLDLQRGDQVTIWGRQIQVRGEPLVVAHRVRAGGQTLNLARQPESQQRQGRQR